MSSRALLFVVGLLGLLALAFLLGASAYTTYDGLTFLLANAATLALGCTFSAAGGKDTMKLAHAFAAPWYAFAIFILIGFQDLRSLAGGLGIAALATAAAWAVRRIRDYI